MVWPSVRPVRVGRTSPAGGKKRGQEGLLRGGLARAVLLVAVLAACQAEDPARAGAERFIDQYYVQIDLPAAMEHASGFAVAKLEREQELLDGIAAPEAGGKPQVNYRFLTEREGSNPGHRGFLYELTISFAGGQVVRRTLVTVAEEGGVWRAVNFQEID